MTREQGTAPTSVSHLKIVGTAYGFNTAFPPGQSSSNIQCSEHIRLSFTGTNLARPPLFTFLPICCTVYNSAFFTESGKYKWILHA